MIIKYGDGTESLSAEKTAMICSECGRQVLKINGRILCGCSASSEFDKSSIVLSDKNLTQNTDSTTSENK